MRGKERLKMGGKEEKRGACRGKSLITYRPHFCSTTKPLIKEWRERRAKRCGDHARKGRGEEKSSEGKVEVWMRRGKSAKEQHQGNI